MKEKHGRSPAKRLEHVLHPWVAYLILPLFAFANAGVSLQGVTLDGLTSILPLGIIAGLLIGKPLGISLFCWLALRLKLAHLPGNDLSANYGGGDPVRYRFYYVYLYCQPGLW